MLFIRITEDDMKRKHFYKPDRFIPNEGEHYIRVNISITQGHISQLAPLIQKHDNNLSAAVREAINIATIVLDEKVKVDRPGLRALMDEFYTKLVFYTEGQK